MEKDKPEKTDAPDEINAFLSKVKFRKKLFGGVDEYDVFRKIRELNDLYAKEMDRQRAAYEALLKERERLCKQATEYKDNFDADGESNE